MGSEMQADVDQDHAMLWIRSAGGVTIGIGLFEFIEATYFEAEQALGINCGSAISFVELPCSIDEATELLSAAGWGVTSLKVY